MTFITTREGRRHALENATTMHGKFGEVKGGVSKAEPHPTIPPRVESRDQYSLVDKVPLQKTETFTTIKVVFVSRCNYLKSQRKNNRLSLTE